MRAEVFDRTAAVCALAAGAAGLAYSIAFVIYLDNGSRGAAYADALLLIGGGAVAIVTFTALYRLLAPMDAGFALLGYVIALAGAFGALLHGGNDLAELATPPGELSAFPSPTDPRGIATFALTAAGLGIVSWLILADRVLPRGLGYLGLAAAALLLYTYIGRLTIFNPKDAVLLVPAVAVGFIVNPLWYAWLGVVLWRRAAALPPREASARR